MNDAVDQLRSAVERTMAARTARFANLVIEQQGYGPIDIGMPDEEMANLPSGTRVGVRRLQGSPSLSVLGLLWVLSLVSRPTWWRYQRRMRRWRELNAGSVDFASRAILRKSGAVFGLRVDDRRFVGETGKWFELGPQPHHFTSPFWALELLRWVTHADEVAPETLHGVRCRHFSGRCDFRLAASRLGMAPPEGSGADELDHLPVEAWLDREGRVCRLQLVHRGSEADEAGMHTTRRAQIEFFDFDAPPPLELPGPEQFVSTDPRPPA